MDPASKISISEAVEELIKLKNEGNVLPSECVEFIKRSRLTLSSDPGVGRGILKIIEELF